MIGNDPVAQRLWKFIDSRRTAVWVGAGLSTPSGYPDLRDLANQLAIDCLGSPPSPNLASVDYYDHFDRCKTINNSAYHAALKRIFRPRQVVRRAYGYLTNLPFHAYLTTNFDPLLDHAATAVRSPTRYVFPSLNPAHLLNTPPPFYYIHGKIDSGPTTPPDNIVLTRTDFDLAYRPGEPVPTLLSSLLTLSQVLFVGCSLEDPTLEEVFRRARDLQASISLAYPKTPPPKHVALCSVKFENTASAMKSGHAVPLRNSDREVDETRRFAGYGVEVVRYERAHDDHQRTALDDLLQRVVALGNREPVAEPGW